MTKKKTVGIIGAGPAGLVVLKELRRAGWEATAWERQGGVGGRWARGDHKTDTGVWHELCLNLTRRWMEFSDFAWDESHVPKHGPDFKG